MAFGIGNVSLNTPDSIYKAIDASSAKVFGVKFYKKVLMVPSGKENAFILQRI